MSIATLQTLAILKKAHVRKDASGGAISTVDLQAGGLLRPEQGGRTARLDMQKRRLRKPVLLGKSCSEIGKDSDFEAKHGRDPDGKFAARGQDIHTISGGTVSVISGDNHVGLVQEHKPATAAEARWTASVRRHTDHALTGGNAFESREKAENWASEHIAEQDRLNPAPPPKPPKWEDGIERQIGEAIGRKGGDALTHRFTDDVLAQVKTVADGAAISHVRMTDKAFPIRGHIEFTRDSDGQKFAVKYNRGESRWAQRKWGVSGIGIAKAKDALGHGSEKRGGRDIHDDASEQGAQIGKPHTYAHRVGDEFTKTSDNVVHSALDWKKGDKVKVVQVDWSDTFGRPTYMVQHENGKTDNVLWTHASNLAYEGWQKSGVSDPKDPQFKDHMRQLDEQGPMDYAKRGPEL